MSDISKEQLRDLVIAADDESMAEGAAPNQRSLPIVSKVMKRLGYGGYIMFGSGAHPMVAEILSVHSSLYRPKDLGMGGVHGGVFMFRDVFARISIPLGYGKLTLDPFTLTDLTQNQLGWLGTRPLDVQRFLDQFTDVMDFAGGIGNFGNYKLPPKAALEKFQLAAFQMQAAAAALSVAFDFRGAIQSALIGAELAIKGGLKAGGASEQACEKYRHHLDRAARAFAEKNASFDLDRVLRVISTLPPYVENRYSANQPGRIETGHIVMGCQFIAGEVMRQVTGFTIRNATSQPQPRVYPE
ncbi:hypothetical protein IVB14_17645 [Bradyrhizobium sp. 180]|uniref:hypothetical protein n=1 Tax=Bradyrhizobium sp. 180 TaxID=2782650 RepID=UPI001FFA8AD3|nr:hypothetical protein [Bradyrhizobium sp. 180]MCK1492195.1 hypothetical protein [Bradyrhizobium sp. 180]